MATRLPLEVKNVVKTYQKGSAAVEAVKGVSFSIQKGEIFGLLGPNGAGKTSLISMMTTLERPNSGDLLVFGDSVQEHPQRIKLKLGVVPQEIVSPGFFDLVELLEFQSGYYGRFRNRERIDYLLHRLGLWEHRKKMMKQLSGGMKRRMMIAKALVHEPQILLLDEPTAGVDIELRTSLWEFVSELKSQGVAILLTTHYLQEAEALCDRLGILDKGQILMCGRTSEIISSLTKRTVVLTFSQDRQARLGHHDWVKLESPREVVFEIPQTAQVGELLQGLGSDLTLLQDIKVREGSLEEAFLHLIQKERA